MGKKPFYENLIEQCEKIGEKPSPLLRSLGHSAANLKKWQKGGTVNSDIILHLAEYFDVSTDYLLTGEDKRYEENERYIDFLENLLIMLSKRHEETSDILREKAKIGETNAYFEIPQIQGTPLCVLLYSLSLAETSNTIIDAKTFDYAKERLTKRCGEKKVAPTKSTVNLGIIKPTNSKETE